MAGNDDFIRAFAMLGDALAGMRERRARLSRQQALSTALEDARTSLKKKLAAGPASTAQEQAIRQDISLNLSSALAQAGADSQEIRQLVGLVNPPTQQQFLYQTTQQQQKQKFTARENEKDRQLRERLASIKSSNQKPTEAQVAEGLLPGNVGVIKGKTITKDIAKDIQGTAETGTTMLNALSKLEAMVAGTGTNFVGKDSDIQADLVKALQIGKKNLAELGALTAPDIPFLNVPDPTTFRSNLVNIFGPERIQNRLKSFRRELLDQVVASYRSKNITSPHLEHYEALRKYEDELDAGLIPEDKQEDVRRAAETLRRKIEQDLFSTKNLGRLK